MSRAAAVRPFWQSAQPTPQALPGRHADLVTAALTRGLVAWPYDKTAPYEVGDLLQHGKYGTGCVVGCPSPGRCLVRFGDGDKLMISGQPR